MIEFFLIGCVLESDLELLGDLEVENIGHACCLYVQAVEFCISQYRQTALQTAQRRSQSLLQT